jgi:hypothetical protein
MTRRALQIAIPLAFAIAGVAYAQSGANATVTVAPNVVGKGSTFHVSASGDFVSSGNQLPQSIALFAARGFRVDPRSRAARCTSVQASSYSCPSASRVGSGTVSGHASLASLPGASQPFTATIDAFLAPRQQRGDIAGVVIQIKEPNSGFRTTATGRIFKLATGPFGIELLFPVQAAGPAPAGVTIHVDRVELGAGAHRSVRKRVRTHSGRRRYRRVRYDLIVNPRTCAGAWAYRLQAQYADHAQTQDGSVACRAA